MRITHLSTYDNAGGAARAAYRLHKGLIAAGQESRMVTLFKESVDRTVILFDPPRDTLTRVRRGLKRRLLERVGNEISARPPGLGLFTDDRSQHGADVLRQLPPTEVLNLHWVAGFIGYRPFFRRLPSELPVVWTLHDMNPFTGGCHHAGDCNGFHARCGACPQLGSSVEKDTSRQVWNRKRQAYGSVSGRKITLVTPSRWLAARAKESSLGQGFQVAVIPNGLSTEIFRPRDRRVARQAFGLAPEAKVVLFASYYSKDGYKGFPTLLDALARVRGKTDLVGLTVGLGAPELFQGSPVPIKTLGFIEAEERTALVYCAADLFVLPSCQDNFPNTAVEALACGLPVIGSNVGGIPEIVRDGITGLLVEPGDARALAGGIEELAGNRERREEMSANCRRVAVQEYALEIQAERYVELYSSLVQKGHPKWQCR